LGSGDWASVSVSDGEVAEDDDDDGASPSAGYLSKKHVCAQCKKRFNRPSSLRIHTNTHSGATRASSVSPSRIPD
jgi:uncharacterized Zn-finger protein